MDGELSIRVNGRARPYDASSVAELVEKLGLANTSGGIAVAVNGTLVPRTSWAAKPLAPEDEVEIVGAVQGG